MATSDCAGKKKIKPLKDIHILVSKRAEFSCYVVTVGGAHGQQLNVLQVEEVPVDTRPTGFLFNLFFFLLLSLFKHGSWRPIKTHNQKLTACSFVL